MASIETVKMVTLAALLFVAAVICEIDGERENHAEPILQPMPNIDVRVLAG